MDTIKVGMADVKTASRPCLLTTVGLGSCVGIALLDIVRGVSGMAHIMLPNSQLIANNSNRAKFADTAVDVLIEQMLALGARQTQIVAKLAGGACMFGSASGGNSLLNIGERNIVCSQERLRHYRIPILSMDTGGDYGRTIELNSLTGVLKIKTVGHGLREI